MEVLDGSTVFFLIVIGMLAGGFTKLVLWRATVGLVVNIISGVLGALVVGGLTISLGLPGGLIVALLGSLGIVFILNVFHIETATSH